MKKRLAALFLKGFLVLVWVMLLSSSQGVLSQPYKHQRCSNRLENALEHMRRRSLQVKKTRSFSGETPYTLYHSFYGQHDESEDDFYDGGDRGYYAKNIQRNSQRPFTGGLDDVVSTGLNQRQPHKLAAVSSVDVEDLRVRLPARSTTARWVQVDKCKFSTENATLDTRLVFPDLTISGKVVLQPAGGKCHMILRLRHAGIEFRTIPIGFDTVTNEESSRRIGAASVRTDSHFAEPGFISVFAHGCQGPTGIRLRQNSKRRFGFTGEMPQRPPKAPEIEISEPHVVLGTGSTGAGNRWRKYFNPYLYDIRSEGHAQANRQEHNRHWVDDRTGAETFHNALPGQSYRDKRELNAEQQPRHAHSDQLNFNDDILNVADDDLQDLLRPDARAFAELFGEGASDQEDYERQNVRDQDEAGDAFTNELEKIFSLGVRGLLTTYMQRALQPAIKETLMENMGYTLSYG